ncbi:MAG: response regulator [Anaerolineae bacterium]|nr:response regulator [Anaerolineae bacterium]
MMSKSESIRILYMEDDPATARLFQRKLEREGYVVDLACDGEEGLTMYEAASYDVLAVDQSMPNLDGLAVIRALASQKPFPPLIVVTASGDARAAVEAMKLGASDYIIKDVDGAYLDLLPAVIEQVLHQHNLTEERERLIVELQKALAAVKVLAGLIPICASCKKIRTDEGYWEAIEVYIRDHSEADFTHSICPECVEKLYGDVLESEV